MRAPINRPPVMLAGTSTLSCHPSGRHGEFSALTISSNGAIVSSIGKRSCESHLSRKDETMKLTLPACRGAIHAHQIHTSLAGRPFGTEELAQKNRQGNGRVGLASRGSALAEIHQPESGQRPADECTDVVHDGCVARAGRSDVESHPRSYARDGRDDRTGQRVIDGGAPTALPQDITLIVREALRAAALAPTVFDALDVTGDALRHLAELAREEVQK